MSRSTPPRRDTLLPGLPSIPPRVLYLVLVVGGVSFLMSVGFTVFGVYVVTEANLNPMQLVLAGTALELSVFIAERNETHFVLNKFGGRHATARDEERAVVVTHDEPAPRRSGVRIDLES